MIKAEVVFDDDTILVNGKIIYITGGLEQSVCLTVDNTGFYSLEDAVKYCLEKEDE